MTRSKPPITLEEFARMGGKARAAKLTPQRRTAIARKASKARWRKAKEKAAAGWWSSLK